MDPAQAGSGRGSGEGPQHQIGVASVAAARRQAEIDRLLEAPAMSKRSLLQLRARLEMSPTAAIMDQLVVDE